jgi:hypothetical protein
VVYIKTTENITDSRRSQKRPPSACLADVAAFSGVRASAQVGAASAQIQRWKWKTISFRSV